MPDHIDRSSRSMPDTSTDAATALPADTRGIVDPAGMMRVVDFARHPAGPSLDGLVEWFWSVAWSLPPGEVREQQVLNHPAGNISIGTLDDAGNVLDPAQGRVYGLHSNVSMRRLTGDGWTVAARTTVGGLGVFLDRPARDAGDAELTLDAGVPGIDGAALVAQVIGAPDTSQRVDRLREALAAVIARRPPALIAEAREVAALASLAENDRSICRTEQLASAGAMSVRTLQRLFDRHVGASPAFVIRRWRIIEAAEAARTAIERAEAWRSWADVAAELGYADQAHLSREFKRYLGTSPAAYVADTRS